MKYLASYLSIIFFFLAFSVLNAQESYPTKQAPLPCLNKTFSIVAHIVRDTFGMPNVTEGEIQEKIDALNTLYEPICASFEICKFNYIDNFQYDDVAGNDWEEMQVKYHLAYRINMFFVSSIEGATECGFTEEGDIANTQSSGILIVKGGCLGSASTKTIPHQMGHYFGLMHTFEGEGVELVNGDNCDTEGDLICDTPADPYVLGEPINNYINVGLGCRFISGKTDANGEYYIPHTANIMSYYPDECGRGFSYEQYLLMANTYLEAADKMW
ncbi:MAG: hypothetical protein GY705_14350 [Bacteroidetes bacterium]|nr:hypothetical protein [Bacteroidota bacterium]